MEKIQTGSSEFISGSGDPNTEGGAYKKAAGLLLSGMKQATGTSRGSVYTSSNYTGLNWSTVPSVLVEMGFMSNYAEDYKLSDSNYQKKLVEGMVSGVMAYFGRSE